MLVGYWYEIFISTYPKVWICNKDEKLLHSSQLIESLFGRLKFLEKEQSKRSFTNLILSIGAIVSKKTPTILKEALEKVTNKMIND